MIWLYLTLFVWSFAAATVLPLGSEVALAGVVATQHTLLLPIAVATLGNVLGSTTTFWLGRAAGTRWLHPATSRGQRTLALMQRWGAPTLLLAWVPLLGDVLVGAAGAMGVPFAPSLVWLTIGKLGRYLFIGWATLALLR